MGLIQTPEETFNTIVAPEDLQLESEVVPEPEKVLDHKAVMATVSSVNDAEDLAYASNTYSQFRERIDGGEEEAIRTELADRQLQQKDEAHQQLMQEAGIAGDEQTFGELFNSYAQFKNNALINQEQQKKVSLEQETVDRLQANAIVSDPVQAKAVDGEFSYVDSVRNDAIKYQIYAQELERRTDKWKADQTTVGLITDILGLALPTAGVFDRSENIALPDDFDEQTKIFSGQRLDQEASYLFSLPVDQFPDAMMKFMDNVEKTAGTLAFNPTMANEILVKAMERSAKDAASDDALGIFNTLGWAGEAESVVAALAKAGTNVARISKAVGNAKLSADVLATKIMGTADAAQQPILNTIPLEEAITDALPSAYVPLKDLAGSNLPESVAQGLERITAIGDRVKNMQVSKSLSPDEIEKAVAQVTEEVQGQLGNIKISDVKAVDDPSSSLTKMRIKVGKTDGLGFANPETALNWVAQKGFNRQDLKAVLGTDGRYYVQFDKVVEEAKVLDGFNLDELTKNPFKQIWQTYVANPSSYIPRAMADFAAKSTYTEGFISKQIFNPLGKEMKLSSASQKILTQVAEESLDAGKDLSYTELSATWKRISGKDITDKEAIAYYAGKQISDTVWTFANKSMYEDLARRGLKTVELDNPKTGFTLDFEGADVKGRHGKVVQSTKEPLDKLRIYDASNDKLYAGTLHPDTFAKYKAEGYELIRLDRAAKIKTDPIEYILARRGDFKIKELSPIQLEYKKGTIGSRFYGGKWFVKQGNTGQFSDGSKYVLNPITHAVGATKTEMQAWANKWESARQAFLDFEAGKINQQQAETIISKTNQIETLAEMKKLIADGEINKDHAFEVLFDRQKPVVTSTGFADLATDAHPMTEFFTTNGRAIYSPRGRRLVGPQDEDAKVLDVFSSLSRGVQTATRSGAFDAYRSTMVDKWYRTAERLGALKPSKSPVTAIADLSPYVDNIDPLVKGQLELIRKPLLRQLDARTKIGEFWKNTARSIGEWVEGKTFLGKDVGTKVAPKVYDMMSANPVSALRGFAFDLKLGAFNPAQLLIQTQQMFNATLISPVFGMKSMGALPWVRLALANGTDNVIDYLAKTKGISAMHGMEPAEFKLYMKELKNSGITDIAANVMQLDQYSSQMHYSKLTRALGEVHDKSRIFFNEAEKLNRITAHGIAWREFRKDFPKADITSDFARKKIAGRVDTLSANMMNNSSAYWNKGVLSFPTQFLSYQERLVSQILGGKQLTGAEKARLAAGQLLMYGTVGIPATTYAYNQLNEALGREATEEEYRTVTGGVWDAIFRHFLNADVAFSKRVAVGYGLENLWKQLSTGEFVDVVTGPTFNITGQVASSVRNAALIMSAGHADNFTEVSKRAVIEVAKNISTMSNTTKALWMHNYNAYLTNTGKITLKDEFTLSEEIMQVLGVTPIEVSDASDLYLRNRSIEQGDMKRMGDLVKSLQLQAAIKGDYETTRLNFEIIQGVVAGIESNPYKAKQLINKLNQANFNDTEYMKIVNENFRLEGPTTQNQLGLTKEETQ